MQNNTILSVLQPLAVPTGWTPNNAIISQIQDMFKRGFSKKGKKAKKLKQPTKIYDAEHFAYIIANPQKFDTTFRYNVLNFWNSSYSNPGSTATSVSLYFFFQYLIEGDDVVRGQATTSVGSSSSSSSSREPSPEAFKVRKQISNLLRKISYTFLNQLPGILVSLMHAAPTMCFHREVFDIACYQLEELVDLANARTVARILEDHITDDEYVESALSLFASYMERDPENFATELVPLVVRLGRYWHQRGSVSTKAAAQSFSITSSAMKVLTREKKAELFNQEYTEIQTKAVIQLLQRTPLSQMSNQLGFISQLAAEKLISEETIAQLCQAVLDKLAAMVEDQIVTSKPKDPQPYKRSRSSRESDSDYSDDSEDDSEKEEEAKEEVEEEEEEEEEESRERHRRNYSSDDDDELDLDRLRMDLDEGDNLPFAIVTDSLGTITRMVDSSEQCLQFYFKYLQSSFDNMNQLSNGQKIVVLYIWAAMMESPKAVKHASEFIKMNMETVGQILESDESLLLPILNVFDSILGCVSKREKGINTEDATAFINFMILKMEKYTVKNAEDEDNIFEAYASVLTNKVVEGIELSLESSKALHSIMRRGLGNEDYIADPVLIYESFGAAIPYTKNPELQDLTMSCFKELVEDAIDYSFDLNSCLQLFVATCGSNLKNEHIHTLFQLIMLIFANTEMPDEDRAMFGNTIGSLIDCFPEEMLHKMGTKEMQEAVNLMSSHFSEECADFFIAVAKHYFHRNNAELLKLKKITISMLDKAVAALNTSPLLSGSVGYLVKYLPRLVTEKLINTIITAFGVCLSLNAMEEAHDYPGDGTDDTIPGICDFFGLARVINAYPVQALARMDELFSKWMHLTHTFFWSTLCILDNHPSQLEALTPALLLVPQSSYFQTMLTTISSGNLQDLPSLIHYTHLLLLLPDLTTQQKYQVSDILMQIKRSCIGSEHWRRFLTLVLETEVSDMRGEEHTEFRNECKTKMQESIRSFLSLVPKLKIIAGFSDITIVATTKEQ